MAKKKAPRPLSAATRKKREVSKHWSGVFGGMSKTAKDRVSSSNHPSAKVFKRAAKNAERRAKSKKK